MSNTSFDIDAGQSNTMHNISAFTYDANMTELSAWVGLVDSIDTATVTQQILPVMVAPIGLCVIG